MDNNDWRNARIEEAARAIFEADPPNNPHGPNSDLVFDEPYTRDHSARARKHARAALAVFEKALGEATVTPTDDYEAGYAEGFHHGLSTPRGAAEDDRACAQCGGQECPRGKCEWDAFLSHRTQGAPSDARVKAAAEAMTAYERNLDRQRGDESQRIWGHRGAFVPEFHPTQEGRARAALRAAFAVGEEGVR